MSDRTKPSVVIGTLLIAFGVLVFLGEIFKSTIFHLWPLFIIAAGLMFFIAMFVAGKSTGYLAIPGSIITHGWPDPVLPGFDQSLGNLVLCLGTYSPQCRYRYVDIRSGIVNLPELCSSGRHVINVGLILFVVFGVFFELLIGISGSSRNNELLWPLALVALGIYLMFSRLILER